MELLQSWNLGSGNPPGGFSSDIQFQIMENLQFRDEIRTLIADTHLNQALDSSLSSSTSNSFTALLGLSTNQAIQLLHHPPIPFASVDSFVDRKPSISPPNPGPKCNPNPNSPSLPAFASVGESTDTASGSSDNSNSNSNSDSLRLKTEPVDSDSNFNSAVKLVPVDVDKQILGKRKVAEKSKVKACGKKSKNAENERLKSEHEKKTESEKLPYVHVRARRGQATDSHSLAERARREKINARMKLLQDLVPGCNKISGTALVLDEIINHVQSLQRQVEFLSMRLAAVNPRIDFGTLDPYFTSDNGDLTAGNVASMFAMDPMLWSQAQASGARRQQQLWQVDLSSWQRDDSQVLFTPENTILGYDSANSVGTVAEPPNQIKMEL